MKDNFAHCAKFHTPCETIRSSQIISHTIRNFAWYAKFSCAPTPLDFYLQIFCVISYFLLVINLDIFFYIFLYIMCVTSLVDTQECIHWTLVNSRSKKYTELLLCLSFSFCFHFSFLPKNLRGWFLRGWVARFYVSWSEES